MMSTEVYLFIIGILCILLFLAWIVAKDGKEEEPLPPLPKQIGRPLPPEPPPEPTERSPFAPKPKATRIAALGKDEPRASLGQARRHWKATEERLEVEAFFRPIGEAAKEVEEEARKAMEGPSKAVLPSIDWGK